MCTPRSTRSVIAAVIIAAAALLGIPSPARAQATIPVPYVIGMDPATARATIAAAGLYPLRQTFPDTLCPETPIVSWQWPGAGAVLSPGGPVTYRVSVRDPSYCR